MRISLGRCVSSICSSRPLIRAGTDVNVHLTPTASDGRISIDDRSRTILAATRQARAIVAFSDALRDGFIQQIEALLGNDSDNRLQCRLTSSVDSSPLGAMNQSDLANVRQKLVTVVQAVDVGERDADTDPTEVNARGESCCCCLRSLLGLSGESTLILLPTGLRPVKAPTFALAALQEWHRQQSRGKVHLVIVGPQLDPQTSNAVFEACGVTDDGTADGVQRSASCACDRHTVRGGVSGAWYSAPIPRRCLLSWMAEADILLNTSESEGMANRCVVVVVVGYLCVCFYLGALPKHFYERTRDVCVNARTIAEV